jgi:hypothetical protein
MRLFAVPACIGFCAIAAPAHPQVVMKNYNFDEMRLAVQEVGSEVQREDADAEGRRFLQAKTKSGLGYALEGRACDNKEPSQRCLGLNLSCSFLLKSAGDAARALEISSYETLRSSIENGELKLSRYVIFDFGITPANLKTNITVFLDIADKVWADLDGKQMLKPADPAASAPLAAQ